MLIKKLESFIEEKMKEDKIKLSHSYSDVIIHSSKFEDQDLGIFRPVEDKRYNLKLYNSDIALLDEMSKEIGISRNSLINFVLDRILEKWLFEVSDLDTQALIAFEADKRVPLCIANPDRPWTSRLFGFFSDRALKNTLKTGDHQLVDHITDPALLEALGLDREMEIKAEIKKAKDNNNLELLQDLQKKLKENSPHTESFFAVKEVFDKE